MPMDVSEPRSRGAPQEEPSRQPAVKPVRPIRRSDVSRRRALLLRKRVAAARRRRAMQLLLPWGKRLATLAIMLVAVLMALVTWDYYVTAPWTRDGRVR